KNGGLVTVWSIPRRGAARPARARINREWPRAASSGRLFSASPDNTGHKSRIRTKEAKGLVKGSASINGVSRRARLYARRCRQERAGARYIPHFPSRVYVSVYW